MSRGTQELVRDLARLLLKYPLEDWRAVLDELVDKKRASAIGKAVQGILRERLTKATASKRKGSRPTFRIKGKHKATLTPLFQALKAGDLLKSRSDFRAAYAAIGPKEPMSSSRAVAIEQLVGHLDQLDVDALKSALAKIAAHDGRPAGGAEDDYRRWFAMIVGEKPTSARTSISEK